MSSTTKWVLGGLAAAAAGVTAYFLWTSVRNEESVVEDAAKTNAETIVDDPKAKECTTPTKTKECTTSASLKSSEEVPKQKLNTHKFQVGQKVLTPYGNGEVLEYRTSDSTYVVKMQKFEATSYLKENDIVGTGIFWGKQAVRTPYGEGFISNYRYEDDTYIITMTSFGAEAYLKADDLTPIFGKGDIVCTPYGSGKIFEFRPSDGMYVVQLLQFTATAYLRVQDMTC